MPEEPWNKHTPGDPMPCKCGDSVVEARFRSGACYTALAEDWKWGKIENFPGSEITAWRFVERKGEDVIADGPYTALEWRPIETAPRDGSVIIAGYRREEGWWSDLYDAEEHSFDAATHGFTRDVAPLTHWLPLPAPPPAHPAPALDALLSVATDDEADAIRSAARRANIEVPK